MQRTIKGVPAGPLAAAVLLVGAAPLVAQQVPSPRQLTFGISTELRAHSNLDLDPVSAGPTVRFDTPVSLGFLAESPVSTLSFTADALLRAEKAPGTDEISTDLENPRLSLAYDRVGADSRFSFGASYARTDIDVFDVVFDDQLDDVDLIIDTGTRENYSFSLLLETGMSAPLGVVLDLGHRGTRYSGTNDPGLFDSSTSNASVQTILRFSPVTEGTVLASVTHYEDEDIPATVRDTYALSLGLSHELSPIATLDASVGGRQIDETGSGTRRGLDYGLSYDRQLPRGLLALTLDSRFTNAGRTNRLDVLRRFEFPRSILTVSLGAVDATGIDPQPVGSLDWSHDLPLATVSAGLSRNVSVDSDADLQRTTQARLGIDFGLTPQSAVSLDIDYGLIEGDVTETERGSFGATYSHTLTQDWVLSAGYQLRYLSQGGNPPGWDNAVFVGIGRTFTLLP